MALLRKQNKPLSLAAARVMAVDTETTLIAPTQYGIRRMTRTAPPSVPTFVLGSVAYGHGETAVHDLQGLVTELREWRGDLVFHNLSFDWHVLVAAEPSLADCLVPALFAGRIHDTKIRDMALQIANGTYTVQGGYERVIPSTLAALAQSLLGRKLDKSDDIRLNFGQYLGRLQDVPQAALEYAAEDAYTTLAVWAAQERRLDLCKPDREATVGASRRSLKNSLTTEVIGSVALSWMERFPFRVDTEAITAYRTTTAEKCAELEEVLIERGFGRRGPKTKRFSLSLKKVRTALGALCAERTIVPEVTDTGLLGTSSSFWKEHITEADALYPWLRYTQLRKLLTTYLDVYASSPVHYTRYFAIGARTYRTSSSTPNVQNIPKHRDSIRRYFVPSPGWKFVEGDYKAGELSALAQTYHELYGGSVLGRAISAGHDPHVDMARRLVGPAAWSDAELRRRGHLRQLAKAVNFGLPGGLGPRKFAQYAKRSYGVALTVQEARKVRQDALKVDPELCKYLADLSPDGKIRLAAHNLGTTPEGLLGLLETDNVFYALQKLREWSRDPKSRPELHSIAPPAFNPKFDLFRTSAISPSGAIRGRALYTQAHNFPFQNLIAAALKYSLGLLYVAWRSDGSWRPVVTVHDSILLECIPGRVEETQNLLKHCMLVGLQHAMPDVPRADVEISGPKETWKE